jgi:hypothetical protein
MCGKKEMPVIVVGNDYWIFDFSFACQDFSPSVVNFLQNACVFCDEN